MSFGWHISGLGVKKVIGQVALGSVASVGEMDQMITRGPCQPQAFCDILFLRNL